MAKKDKNNRKKLRLRAWVQICFTALTNGYVTGFAAGKIFKGVSKRLCLPGLNCYSCPGALGACPIGSLQAILGSRKFGMSFYVVGFLLLVGALAGRFVCGWLCPFGLVQDLLHKIPLPFDLKKARHLPGEKVLRFLKYGILIGFVIVLPLTVVDIVGQGSPWFCKLICPSGMLMAGIPLAAQNASLRESLGWLFTWKTAVLVALLLLSLWVYRPFCRYLCPLGAIYGCMNPVALYRYTVDSDKCIHCDLCQKACPMDIPVQKTPNSPECIRCGRCKEACPVCAIQNANTLPGKCAAKPNKKKGNA